MAVQYTIDQLCSKISGSYSYTNAYTKKVREADVNVQDLQGNIEEFRKAVRNLRKYSSGVTTKSKLEKYLKDFVESYNDLKKTSGSITDEDLNKELSKLDELIGDNEKALKKIGIKKSDDELTFDEEIFEEIEDDDYIDNLFIGKDSFINQVNKVMRNIEKRVDDSEYETVTKKVSKTTKYDKEKVDLVTSLNSLNSTVSLLKRFNGKVSSESTSEAEKDTINTAIEQFKDLYNLNVIDRSAADESGNLNNIRILCEANEEQLSAMEIAFNTDDGKMQISDNDLNFSSEDFKEAYSALFGEDASFGTSISEYCQEIFHSILNPEKIGVTIIDQYV